MQGIVEYPISQQEIIISIHFIDGELFIQPIPIDDADIAQKFKFINWYRKPGKSKIWSWHVVEHSKIHILNHDHIIGVDIEGYIEPEGRKSKWYERLTDRIMTRRL